MKKNATRFFSMLLVLAMVLSMVPMTVFATEDEAVVETVVETVETTVEATEEATTTPAEEEVDAEEDFSFNVSAFAPALLNADETEVDEEDPAIIAFEAGLKNIKVLNADGDPVPLTEAEIAQILGMYQQYLDHWTANADTLGAQTPFFLQYNDNGEDGLGALGEMLVLAGISVDAVRAGYVSFDDLTGMIQNFLYGDSLGVALYGNAIKSARDEVLNLVKSSGALTNVQKYMIVNNWLAQNASFDMPYIMNNDKEEGEEPMVAENPQKHKYYDTVYKQIYGDYEANLNDTFRQNIRDGLKAEFKRQFYEGAIKQGYYQAVYEEAYAQYYEGAYPSYYENIYNAVKQSVYDEAYNGYLNANAADPANPTEDEIAAATAAAEQAVADNAATIEEQATAEAEAQTKAYAEEEAKKVAESETETFMNDNAETIAADPVAFVEAAFGADAAAQIAEQWEGFWADCEANGVDIDGSGNKVPIETIVDQQMDTPQQDPMLQKRDAEGNPIEGEYMTPNEAIPVFADQAATGLTEGVLNYWEGSHIGIFGDGKGVCLGYTKAFAYLLQCLHSDVYTTNGNIDTASNWKSAKELYYTDGALDINQNYVVDCVRITFDADVTMYGETQENFNSDHFWNAVKVDGKWFYVDPCYVDVYTEVMIRDRVETDGSNNYLYFMFSHGTTTSLYDGYYSEIKTLYADAAVYKDYEDSWVSRIKSNIYSDGTNFYYVYDSTDLVTLMDEYNNNSQNMQDVDMDNSEYKLVYHTLDSTDAGDNGDSDYTTLVEFNHPIEEDSDETVARVRDSSGNLVESEMLTKLMAQHMDDKEIYPSLSIGCAKQGNLLYFNLSNCLLSYNLNTCEVALVKEYNTVYGVRDDTNAFGGMAFTTTTASNADFTVENHPIAGISLKDDGKLYVAIATNFAFISGKDPHNSADQGSYGYEFEETNFNSKYNSYANEKASGNNNMGSSYDTEDNDNDEFMWSANFMEALDMSHLAGTSHSYSSVSVEASCRQNAFTENRCSTCGAIEAGSRVEEADTAHAHHYVEFFETYYTKDDGGSWNSGTCYVCTECLFATSEPSEPDPDEDYESYGTTYEEQLAIYEEEKAIYDEAVATAGHTYVATDATWNEDYSTATFSNVTCSAICPDAHLDCLIEDETITRSFTNAVTISGSEITGYTGDCTTGAYCHYRIVGETNGITVTAETSVQLEAGEHPYTAEFTWTKVVDENGNEVLMDNGYAQYTASAVLSCGICGDTQTDDSADITVEVIAPTVEEQGKVLYTAKAIATDANGAQIGSASDVKEITLVAAPEATITNITSSGKIQVKWGKVDGAVAYNVYRSTDGGATYTLLKTVTGTKLNNTSAVTGETYYYYVTAVSDDDMESAASATLSRICKLAQPSVTLSNVASTGKIKISWEEVKDAVKYEIYRSTDGGENYTKLTSTSKTSVVNTSAEAGVKYRYKVLAIAENPEANSAYSSAKNRTCDLPRTTVTLGNVAKTGKVTISWEAVEGAVKYQVYRSEDGGETYTKLTTTSKTSITNTSAEAGVTYYYKVRAVHENTDANSAFSEAKKRACDLAQPDVSISRSSKGKPVVKWDAVKGADKYKVYRATSKDGDYELLTTTSKTSVTNTSAKSGKTYYYKVRAIDSDNSSANSAYSAIVSIKSK